MSSDIGMAVTEVVLGVPETPNLNDLADSTSLAFSILRPWCVAEFQSGALIVIQRQAKAYVKAIDFSITAAQHGYNVTQEALAFSKLIDSSNEKDRQQYLCGMLSIARQGEHHARLANKKFRDVRSMVGKFILEARKQDPQTHSDDSFAAKELDDLEGGLGALEKFSTCISSYVAWWNVINMSHVAQTARLDQVVVNYNSLRLKDVVQKWRELGQQYVEYSNKIQSIQDSYPDFASELKASMQDPFSDLEPCAHQESVTDDLNQEPIIVDSPPVVSMMFHLPGALFAARYRDQQTRLRKRDRIRKFGQRVLSAIGAR